MKALKAEAIRDMTHDEIGEKILSLKKELFNLRVQAKTGKLEKQDRIFKVKRDIARLLTIHNEQTRQTAKK